jgi:hypothetical protein
MKKPRGDAKLKILPDALQEELWQLLRRTSIEKAEAWLHTTHGVATSPAALSQFFSWYPRQGWLRQAESFSDTLKATIKNLPALKATAAQAEQIAQVNFEILAAQNRDSDLFLALQHGKLKKAELQLKAENQALRLRQYEEKISHARASLEKAKSKGGLTPETLALIEEQLKLL